MAENQYLAACAVLEQLSLVGGVEGGGIELFGLGNEFKTERKRGHTISSYKRCDSLIQAAIIIF